MSCAFLVCLQRSVLLLTILLFHFVCTHFHLCASTSHPTDSTKWLSEINRELMVFLMTVNPPSCPLMQVQSQQYCTSKSQLLTYSLPVCSTWALHTLIGHPRASLPMKMHGHGHMT
ncbi:hypothetical protein ASPTUDRAFT_420149 [Aspergillus tubingensis CBS 134.48]|uniref:Secreted protein n=1 Tax=Aspergillus tubingensis (strain CBS 134.48) TaxID=767770 RepID=A0A1L9NEH2_ASPTC|nr:hypothetical protein ASPTUDRAFT_420149 [Aspergillus tubingensis CBS 134.48]